MLKISRKWLLKRSSSSLGQIQDISRGCLSCISRNEQDIYPVLCFAVALFWPALGWRRQDTVQFGIFPGWSMSIFEYCRKPAANERPKVLHVSWSSEIGPCALTCFGVWYCYVQVCFSDKNNGLLFPLVHICLRSKKMYTDQVRTLFHLMDEACCSFRTR